MGAATREKRWWEQRGPGLRQDVHDALAELRAYVENQGKGSVILSHLDTYRQKELTAVQTTRVGEWELGYRVVTINNDEGFFMRTVFVKLHGGRLAEINKNERRQIIDALSGALDLYSAVEFEPINATTFAVHQPFAVTFMHECNPNIVTPSKELILRQLSPPAGVGDILKQKPECN
jgi:hypothetical protein